MGVQSWGSPHEKPPRMNGMVAAPVSEAQGLVPSGWRPAGHPQIIMASEPQTVAVGLLPSWGRGPRPQNPPADHTGPVSVPTMTAKRGPGPTSHQEHLSLEEEGIPGCLLSHQPRAPASICPLFALPGPNMGTVSSQQWISPPAQAWSALGHVHLPRCHLDQPRVSLIILSTPLIEDKEPSAPSSYTCPKYTQQSIAMMTTGRWLR